MVKYFLLGLITFGIYPLVVMCGIANDINALASRYDGKKTMHFLLMAFIITPITFGIGTFVWFHKISKRIGSELQRRGIDYDFDAKDYWIWNVLGSFIVVGPFIYFHKLFNATNKIAEHYNING